MGKRLEEQQQRRSIDVPLWPRAEGSILLPYSTADSVSRDLTQGTPTENMELEVAVIAGSEGLGETTSISLVCDKIKYIIISVDNYSNTNNLYSDQNNSVLGDNNMEPRMKRA